jgi:hypothetical protein
MRRLTKIFVVSALSAISIQSLFAAYPHVNYESNQNFRQGQTFYDPSPYDENQYPSGMTGGYHQVYSAGNPQDYPLNDNYQSTPYQYSRQNYSAPGNYNYNAPGNSPYNAGNARYPHQQRYNNYNVSYNDTVTHESVRPGENYPTSGNASSDNGSNTPWFTVPENQNKNSSARDQGNPLTSYRYQSSPYDSKGIIGDNSDDISPSNVNQGISTSNKKGG